MEHEPTNQASHGRSVLSSRKTLLLGIAGTLAAAAWLATREQSHSQSRRYADRGAERRNPMNFFNAGNFPHRRKIDRNGRHPLFERRQSVYDDY